MYIDKIWCLNCGGSLYSKNGKVSFNRQRVKCLICGTQTIIGAMKQGEKMFQEVKLLPFLRKDNSELSKGELYSLGFLIADGSVSQHVQLSCNILKKDVEVLEIIKRELCFNNDIKYYTRNDTRQETVLLTWQYKFAYPYLVAKGLCMNKTGNEFWLPYMNNSHFIRGLFDGDGCLFVNKIKHRYELSFTSGCYNFLEDLNNNLKVLYGVGASKVTTQKNITGDSYRITIYKQGLLKILKELYKDSGALRLERKYNKYLEVLNG
jgi:hypothetical protein